MSWAEIKKAINSDLATPLDTLIKNYLANATYGLSAIKSTLTNTTYGLSAIKSYLANSTYGLSALRSYLANSTYGLSALKTTLTNGKNMSWKLSEGKMASATVTFETLDSGEYQTIFSISGKGTLNAVKFYNYIYYQSNISMRVYVDGTLIYDRNRAGTGSSASNLMGAGGDIMSPEMYISSGYDGSYNALLPSSGMIFTSSVEVQVADIQTNSSLRSSKTYTEAAIYYCLED